MVVVIKMYVCACACVRVCECQKNKTQVWFQILKHLTHTHTHPIHPLIGWQHVFKTDKNKMCVRTVAIYIHQVLILLESAITEWLIESVGIVGSLFNLVPDCWMHLVNMIGKNEFRERKIDIYIYVVGNGMNVLIVVVNVGPFVHHFESWSSKKVIHCGLAIIGSTIVVVVVVLVVVVAMNSMVIIS